MRTYPCGQLRKAGLPGDRNIAFYLRFWLDVKGLLRSYERYWFHGLGLGRVDARSGSSEQQHSCIFAERARCDQVLRGVPVQAPHWMKQRGRAQRRAEWLAVLLRRNYQGKNESNNTMPSCYLREEQHPPVVSGAGNNLPVGRCTTSGECFRDCRTLVRHIQRLRDKCSTLATNSSIGNAHYSPPDQRFTALVVSSKTFSVFG